MENPNDKTNITSHDAFFKSSFSYPDVAQTYIRSFLPLSLVKNLDLDKMTLCETSYISSDLKEHFSDLVWNCPCRNQNIKITFLFEHKSSPVRFPHIQLLRYMTGIWESQLKTKGIKYLDPVVPIIVYNGRQKWKVKALTSYFGNIDTELIQFLPNFKYQLTDLHRLEDEKLLNLSSFKLVISMLALQYYRDTARLSELIDKINKNLFDLEIWNKNENFASTVIVYLSSYNTLNQEAMQNILRKPRFINGIKSTYDQLMEEGFEKGIKKGIEQGIEKGMEKGMETAILKMLTNGFEVELICKVLDVSAETVEKAKLHLEK